MDEEVEDFFHRATSIDTADVIEYGSKNATSVSTSYGRHVETINVDEHLAEL